jgi:membrane-associated protease RseP (regulator of RpoE activity)
MNYHNPLMALAAVLILGLGSTATAATEVEAASKAEAAELQAQLEADYKEALSAVEKDRKAAEATMAMAREQLHLAAEQRGKAAEESTRAHAARQAEMEMMHEELNHARNQLRETSREIARVNREVARARADTAISSIVFSTSDRPVIGVILGDASDVGIKVLGVSPDGPSEQAGIKQGDVIVALGGRVLAAVDESGNPRKGLNIALQEIRALEPIIVSVERGDQTLDLTVVPEVREPLTWHSVSRFSTAPTAPTAPGEITIIERIVVPEIDTEALTEQIERIRINIDKRQVMMESGNFAPFVSEFEFEFHDLSEMGDFALHDANVWFGLPMAQGLKLAEIDPDLGEYFKTDRGVLVLKARADNDLQLESGDVILQVGETEVNSPAEFMRALRDFNSGDEFEIDIKRNRKDRTLKTVMPESRTSFFAPEGGATHTIKIITDPE